MVTLILGLLCILLNYQPVSSVAVTIKQFASPVNSKEKGEGCHSLLTPRQVVHGAETLARGDTVVVHSIQVRLFGVLGPEEGLCTLVLCKSLQDKDEPPSECKTVTMTECR